MWEEFELAQSHKFNPTLSTLSALASPDAQHLQSELDIFQRRAPGKKLEPLKYHTPLAARANDGTPVYEHFAGVRLHQSVDDSQQRRLAAAARSQESDKFGCESIARETSSMTWITLELSRRKLFLRLLISSFDALTQSGSESRRSLLDERGIYDVFHLHGAPYRTGALVEG